MGASAVCMALGDKLPENVKCAISDSGFDSAGRQLSYIYSRKLRMSAKPFMRFFSNFLLHVKDFDLKQADAVSALKKSQVPVLFVHGKDDTLVPTEMVYRLAEAMEQHRREIYVVEGAEHIMSLATEPHEYTKRVNSFLDKHRM